MQTSKFAVSALIVGVVVALVASHATLAQKTAQRGVGKQQNSVYGGYSSSSSSSSQTIQQVRPVRPVPRPQQPRPQPQPQQLQQQQQQQYEPTNDESSQNYDATSSQQEADSEPASYGAVAGKPGVNFPNYAQIPKTSFTCDDKPYDGFYPDEEAQCQAYHVCWENRRESFLCGVGTLFNAANQHCDYWYNVDCARSRDNWDLNRFFGTSTPENAPQSGPVQAPRQQGNRVTASSGQQATLARPSKQRRPVQQPQQQPQQQQQDYSNEQSSINSQWQSSQQVQLQQQEY